MRRLPYSDARAIELVGITMKSNAWDWYQRHIEDQLYQGHPPTWEEFKRAVLDEFLTPAERQNRALQFEWLKQTPRVSVSDYAQEFIRLAKYAPYIVPTEAARVERFRAGLIMPLYNALVATEFPSLTRMIDKAKLLEARYKEERIERDQRKKNMGKPQGGQSKGGSATTVEQAGYPVAPTPYRSNKRRRQFRDAPANPSQIGPATSGVGQGT